MPKATPKTINRLRMLTAGVLAAAAGVVTFANNFGVYRANGDAAPSGRVATPKRPAAAGEEQAAVDPKAAVWRRRWREPLYDPPPPPPPKVAKKVLPPIRAKLLGTIIEPGASKAMIGLPGRRVVFLATGDPLGPQDQNAEVVEIGPSSIKVRRDEEVTELKIETSY